MQDLTSNKVVNKVVQVWHKWHEDDEGIDLDEIIMQIYGDKIWDGFMPKFSTAYNHPWPRSKFEEDLSKLDYNKDNWKIEFLDLIDSPIQDMHDRYITVYYKEKPVRTHEFFDEEIAVKTLFLLSHEEEMLKLLKLAKLKIIEKYYKES